MRFRLLMLAAATGGLVPLVPLVPLVAVHEALRIAGLTRRPAGLGGG